jgi:hypothetical protein
MRGHRWFATSYVLAFAALLFFTTAAWSAQIQVATYNSQFFGTALRLKQ